MRLCERCAKTQPTCCEKATIRLTGGDIQRIQRFTHRSDFSEIVDTSGWESDPDDPLFSTVLIRKACATLKRSERGCPFLSAQGCGLPLDVRPLICRLYPMDYRERGLIGLVAVEDVYCPAPATAELLAELDMADRKQIEAWHRSLYQELRADYEALFGEPWADQTRLRKMTAA